MASSTRKRDRIFAGFGAALFLISACALTVFVIVQYASEGNKTDTAKQDTNTCNIQEPVASTAEANPEVYKPEGAVTSLETTDLTPGTGAEAKAGDCLVMKYYGTLASDGTFFDGNFDKDQALQFTLGKGQVIQGWDQGLVGMKVGGTRRLVIPASLAYGSQSPSAAIPANSDLVFVVKLERIKT